MGNSLPPPAPTRQLLKAGVVRYGMLFILLMHDINKQEKTEVPAKLTKGQETRMDPKFQVSTSFILMD